MNAYGPRRRNAATFFAVLGVFLLTVCLFVGVFRWYGEREETVAADKTYYFLVKNCEDTAASAVAGQVYLSGGAGYILEQDGESAVVLSCYFTERDALRVCGSLEEKGIEARVLTLSAQTFYLRGEKAAERGRVEDNMETVEACARVLYQAANELERGESSQEQARAAVRSAAISLGGLAAGNEGALYLTWNAALMRAERRGKELCEGILFAKDLRYLQTELLLMNVRAGGYFS